MREPRNYDFNEFDNIKEIFQKVQWRKIGYVPPLASEITLNIWFPIEALCRCGFRIPKNRVQCKKPMKTRNTIIYKGSRFSSAHTGRSHLRLSYANEYTSKWDIRLALYHRDKIQLQTSPSKSLVMLQLSKLRRSPGAH